MSRESLETGKKKKISVREHDMSGLDRNTNELLFLEWVVINSCNLNCHYCVNKQFLQNPNSERPYIPGGEVEIAKKIAEIAEHFKKINVNMSGGEPLLAKDIAEALGILAKVPNVSVTLITNFKLIEKIERYIPSLSSLIISLHIKYRDDEEVLKIIRLVNKYKYWVRMTLVDTKVKVQY